jgi:hypothetical protein
VEDGNGHSFYLTIIGVDVNQKTICKYACNYRVTGMMNFDASIAEFKSQILYSSKSFPEIINDAIVKNCKSIDKILEIKEG